MRDDLQAIEDGLLELGRRETVAALRPGASAPVVKARLESAGFTASPALEAWFGWHDGTSDLVIGTIQIIPGYFPLSLAQVIETSSVYRELGYWKPGWLPVMSDGGGYFYIIDQQSQPVGAVRRYRYDFEDQPVEYLSLETFVATIATCYREHAFFVHPGGYLAPDIPRFEQIATALNPGVAWWM